MIETLVGAVLGIVIGIALADFMLYRVSNYHIVFTALNHRSRALRRLNREN